MTHLPKKHLKQIIAMMLIISTQMVNNFIVMADCSSTQPSEGNSALFMGQQINLGGIRRNFSPDENGQLENVNCTTDGEKSADVKKFGLDKRLALQIRGMRITKMFGWLKVLSGTNDNFIGRCFGVVKRLQIVLPIIIFTLGVIVTILVFLSVFSLKSLGIGVLLLILNFGGFIGKLFFLKSGKHDKSDTHGYHPSPIYIPIPTHSNHPQQSPPTPQQIHFHIHNKEPLSAHELDSSHSKNHGSYNYYDTDVAGTGYGAIGKSVEHAHAHAQTVTDDYEPYASGSATSPYRYYKREYFDGEGITTPTAWANRVSSGLAGSTSEAEKRELLELYKRLGFDIRRYLRQMKAQGLKK